MPTITLNSTSVAPFPIGSPDARTALFVYMPATQADVLPVGATVDYVDLTYNVNFVESTGAGVIEVLDVNGTVIYATSIRSDAAVGTPRFYNPSMLLNGGYLGVKLRLTAEGTSHCSDAQTSMVVTYTNHAIPEPTTSTSGTLPITSRTITNLTPAFIAMPPVNPAPDTNYTVTIDLTYQGIREARAGAGLGLGLRLTPNDSTTSIFQTFRIDGMLGLVPSITFVEGRWSGVVQFPAAIFKGIGRFDIRIGNALVGNDLYVVYGSASSALRFDVGFTGGPGPVGVVGTKFSTQPASSPTIGQQLTCGVTAIATDGTTVTGYGGKVTLTVEAVDGSSVNQNAFKGVKTVAAVAGVASFTGLSLLIPGRFRLKATVTGIMGTSVSTPLSITGTVPPEDMHGLRQNLARDGTLWVGTTGYPTVSANPAISNTDRLVLDGDLHVTASSKVVQGIRLVPPYLMYLTRVLLKYKVSSLVGVPYIRILGSYNTTTGVDGIWTEITSYKLETTNTAIRQFELSPTVYKGFWITLDKGAGSATMTWYSTQLFGAYNNSSINFLSAEGDEIGTEGVLSIPYPSDNINSITTKFRKFMVRNNGSAAIYASIGVSNARYPTDAGITGYNNQVEIVGVDELLIGPIVVLPAFNLTVLQLQYTNMVVPTLDGEHFVRITVSTGDLSTSYASNVNNAGLQTKTLDTALSAATSTGGTVMRAGSTVPNCLFDGSVPQWWLIQSIDASTDVNIYPPVAGAGAGVDNISSVVDKTLYNRILPLSTHRALIACEDVITIFEVEANIPPATTTATEAVWRPAHVKFSIPTQTTGPKTMRYGRNDRIWIANGLTSTGVRIYEVNRFGVVYSTINTAPDLPSVTVETHCYDPVYDEVYVVTRNTGAGRFIARYNASTGVFIAKVSNTHEGTVNCQGAVSVGGFLYVFYKGQYLNKYDLQTLANNSRVADWGAAANSDYHAWEGRI